MNLTTFACVEKESITIGTMAPLIVSEEPRLTYSSVIQSLVEQQTGRSPFLQTDDVVNSGDILMLDRKEVQVGQLLGQGNFSNVFEVIGFRLENKVTQLNPCSNALTNSSGQDYQLCDDLLPSRDQELVYDATKLIQGIPAGQQSTQTRNEKNTTNHLSSADTKPRYAIKCLKPELLQKPRPKTFLEAATDLVIEAKFLSRLNHTNILKVRGIAKDGEAVFANGQHDSFFIIFDRLEETLHQRIKRWRQGKLPHENTIENKCHIALQIASALNYLHERNLIFRDLKPQNIGLRFDDQAVQLFDFGFCRELPLVEQSSDVLELGLTRSNATLTLSSGETVYLMSGKGTRRYMAPECLIRNRYNLKADVYSWSMIFWELLTLSKPYSKYNKEQHSLYVCEGGDRPPLEASSDFLWAPSFSFHSPSNSLSSIKSCDSSGEESIDFSSVMTKPIKNLLRRAWDQDVSKRLTMAQVCDSLKRLMDPSGDKEDDVLDPEESPQRTSELPYTCMPSASGYSEVRDLFIGFASEIQEISLSCFGCDASLRQENNSMQVNGNDPIVIIEQCDCGAGADNSRLKNDGGNDRDTKKESKHQPQKILQFRVPPLTSLEVQ